MKKEEGFNQNIFFFVFKKNCHQDNRGARFDLFFFPSFYFLKVQTGKPVGPSGSPDFLNFLPVLAV
jgi:hypothetical protein